MSETYLITGGTGSLGQALSKRLLAKHAHKVIIYSRNEHAQVEMQRSINDPGKHLRFFLGDVRNRDRLRRALSGVDIVIHAAAIKHVDKAHLNPDEAVEINVNGTRNVRDAAIDCGVKKALLISSDKACNPVNLYGATKFCAEKIFTTAIAYSGATGCRFASVRFGNFLGSNGSVLPLFRKMCEQGSCYLPITDSRMTRFFISLDEAVDRIFDILKHMQGTEVFCPKMPSMKIVDIAKAVDPKAELREIGIRPGEKLFEELITQHEGAEVRNFKKFYVIGSRLGDKVAPGFQYRSDENSQWIDPMNLENL